MRRILFLSRRAPHEVLPAALTVGADVKVEPPSPDALARLPDLSPDLLVADAVDAPAEVFDLLTVTRTAGSPVEVLLVVDAGALDSHPWHEVADDFVVAGATDPEGRLRLQLLGARRGEPSEGALRLGPVTIDVETYRVAAAGRTLDLTFKEFELLRFLAEHPGRVFSRAKLLQEVWGYDFFGGTRTVDVHVRRLRAKLGPEHEQLIETVRGVGYRAAGP